MNLAKIFESVSQKLLIDFDDVSSEIKHNPSKGVVREIELIETFLRRYVANRIGISSGEIIASDGSVSSQTDVAFYDAQRSPLLLDKSGYKLFPIEIVYGVMEVKSRLDKNALKDSHDKIRGVKQMKKVAYRPEPSPIVRSSFLYGREWSHYPTIGCLFAYDSIDLNTLSKHLEELNSGVPLHERIDSIWVLKKGMLINWCEKSKLITHSPTPDTRIRAVESVNPLLLMVVQIHQLLDGAWMHPFNIMHYLKHVSYGSFLT